jgi:biotin carboxyl carrier protein
MRFTFQSGEREYSVELEQKGEIYIAKVGDETIEFRLLWSEPGQFSFLIGERLVTASVASDGERRWVAVSGRTFECKAVQPNSARAPGHSRHAAASGGERLVTSPMPGQVRAVSVEPEQIVERGQTLLLLEAMKMEIRVQAPRAGRIARLMVTPGQSVDRDQVLIEIEGDGEPKVTEQ